MFYENIIYDGMYIYTFQKNISKKRKIDEGKQVISLYRLNRINENKKIEIISKGAEHYFFLEKYGNLYGCGSNIYGQLGHGNKNMIFPKPILIKKGVLNVQCGKNHTVILFYNKEIYTTGENKYGQLGLGDNINRFKFEIIRIEKNQDNKINKDDRNDIIQIKCGEYQTFILEKKGELYGCGSNNNGQLDKSKIKKINKMKLLFKCVKKIYVGSRVSFYISTNNEIYAFGDNIANQISSISKQKYIYKPLKFQYQFQSEIQFIESSKYTTYFYLKNGDLYYNGYNPFLIYQDYEFFISQNPKNIVQNPKYILNDKNILSIEQCESVIYIYTSNGIIYILSKNKISATSKNSNFKSCYTKNNQKYTQINTNLKIKNINTETIQRKWYTQIYKYLDNLTKTKIQTFLLILRNLKSSLTFQNKYLIPPKFIIFEIFKYLII